MTTIKLLIVEDDEQEITGFRATADRLSEEGSEFTFEFVESRNLEEARSKANSTFDGAIIDLLLENDESGSELVDEIKGGFRVPIAIYTGTPPDDEDAAVEIFTKAKHTHEHVLSHFTTVFQTGITRVFGGRGIIEKALNDVFWKVVMPNRSSWMQSVAPGKNTEEALVRCTVEHLAERLTDLKTQVFEEEVYISQLGDETTRTGSIFQDVSEPNSYFIVLTPACDLAQNKADMILVCEIHSLDSSLITKAREASQIVVEHEDEEELQKLKRKQARGQRVLESLPVNGNGGHYHFLPAASAFEGGVINFRRIETLKPSAFKKRFKNTGIVVSGEFRKDIVARFSMFYARQGQPDMEFERIVAKLISG